jgi:exodeoxyribonuclease VII large subunit
MVETSLPETAGDNLGIYSVSTLSQALKRALEDGFSFIRVRGEISGFKRHSSGHLYFALKDAEAVIDAVCWRGTAGRLGLEPEDGMEVIASGRITTYAGRSKYQIVIERLELAGEGALLKLLEERRRKLAAEGLFDEARKRPLPYLPDVIGVITSPTGAVIRDILHRIEARFPRHVLLWPVAVQGEGAATQIVAAIRGFNALPVGGAIPRPDLLIVARGGGSLEDLFAFNEESVVRAAAASEIPLISAVGHETDTTLIDYASDRRAPTPTAAAEMAVPVRAELIARMLDQEKRLFSALARGLEWRHERLGGLARGLPDARSLIGQNAQRLDDRTERLHHALHTRLTRYAERAAGARPPHPRQVLGLKRERLGVLAARLRGDSPLRTLPEHGRRLEAIAGRLGSSATAHRDRLKDRLGAASRLLDSLSYQSVLTRGFALVRAEDGAPISGAASIKAGQALTIQFQDGTVPATATASGGKPAGDDGPPRPRKTALRKDGRQGSLL